MFHNLPAMGVEKEDFNKHILVKYYERFYSLIFPKFIYAKGIHSIGCQMNQSKPAMN